MVQQVLLALHCKKTQPVDLKTPIRQYIASVYSPEQARQADEDLEEIQGQRNQIAGMAGALPALRAVMLRYLAALSSIETRFPISKDADHVRVSFLWYDAFRSSKKAEQVSIHFEKAAILFNIGAVTSQIAMGVDRTLDAGVKEASRLFQEAAGAFSLLRDASMKMDSPRPPDVGPETAAMLERLMLAQAQECVFEKVTADRKSPSLLARVAKQVAELYSEVVVALGQPPLSTHLDKTWVSHASVKCAVYEAQAAMCAGEAFRLDDQVASQIACLKDAQKLLSAVKGNRGINKELSDTIKATEEAVLTRLKKAERENAAVYLQRVPASGTLPAIKGVLLVKPVLPKAEEGSGTDVLFSSVIPDNSARALSRYSDMVDAMWREQREKLDAASDEARLKLSQWELPEALTALEACSPAALPEGLRQELESIEDCGGPSFLHGLVAELKGLRETAAATLDRVEADLAAEAEDDDRLRRRHGSTWNRPTSAALNRALLDKAASYRANLAAAAESDARLEARLASNDAEFSRLSVDAALAIMPRLQAPMVAVVEGDPATIVATLRQALDALASLSAERAALEEALKAVKARDDVLPKIMATSEGHAELFAREISKYDAIKADISGNVERQGQLLNLIDSKQSAFRSAFGFSEWRAACKAAAAGVRTSVAAFREVNNNLSEGARFYSSLQEAVSALQQHVGDFCLTRRMQREEMEQEQRRREDVEAANREAAQQLSQLSLGAGSGSTHPVHPSPPPPPMSSGQHGGPQFQAPSPQHGGRYPPAYGGHAHSTYAPQQPPLPPPAHFPQMPRGMPNGSPHSGNSGRYDGSLSQYASPYSQQQQQQHQSVPSGQNGHYQPPPPPPPNATSKAAYSSQPHAHPPQQPWAAPGGTSSSHVPPYRHPEPGQHQHHQQQQQWNSSTGFGPSPPPPPPPPHPHNTGSSYSHVPPPPPPPAYPPPSW